MSGHTPGPWKVIQLEPQGYGDPMYVSVEVESADGRIVASVVHDSLDEHLVNASLIAAAPKLLEALEGLLEQFSKHIPVVSFANARAAIARAKGEK